MDDLMAGFLTYGLQHARLAFPEQRSSGIATGCQPLTVAGTVAEFGLKPYRVPFYPQKWGTIGR